MRLKENRASLQFNARNGQCFVTIPVNIVRYKNLVKGDIVLFYLKDNKVCFELERENDT